MSGIVEVRGDFVIKTAVATLLATLVVDAQAPAFEIASIKPHDPAAGDQGMKITPDGIHYSRVTLYECIRTAYHVPSSQIFNADSFSEILYSDRYDIVARADHRADRPELMQMLQTLLADRCQLRVHRETRELPVYLLVTGKKRLKLETDPGEGETSFRFNASGANFQHTTMPDLAEFLSGLGPVQRPVLDRTSFAGAFKFTLSLSDVVANPNTPFDKRSLFAWASIFADLQEIGLKLEPSKAPVELLIIDHAERPSAN